MRLFAKLSIKPCRETEFCVSSKYKSDVISDHGSIFLTKQQSALVNFGSFFGHLYLVICGEKGAQ